MGLIRTTVLVTAGLTVPGALLPPPLYSGPETAKPSYVDRGMLSQLGFAGKRVYQNECSACHGEKGNGTAAGPSLHHSAYRGAQFSPQDFHAAVTDGVEQRLWTFGDMPAQKLSFNEIELVARYIREVRTPSNYDR